MAELDLFRSFRRGVASPSADARRRASDRLTGEIEGAIARVRGARPHRTMRRVAALAVGVLVVVVATAAAFATVRDLFSDTHRGALGSPAWSPDGRSIAFVVWNGPDGPTEVVIMNADGSAQRTLARERSLTHAPVWSPDSRKVALLTNPSCTVSVQGACARSTTIYVHNADGSGKRRLARGGSVSRNRQGQPTEAGDGFAWSPDGRRIAFVSNRDGNFELYVMNADGSGQRRLTRNTTTDLNPVWSPDGRTIAFVSTTYADPKGSLRRPQVHVMNADGSGRRTLARGDSPSWSPDGRKIVFVHESRYLEREIYVMNADGSRQQNLRRGTGFEDAPRWSPDGRKIAFVRIDGERELINVINPDGSGQRTLTRHVYPGGAPVWSPDGRKIVFVSDGDVYVMNADGSGKRKLSPGN